MTYALNNFATNDPRAQMFAADLGFFLNRNILENRQANQLPIWNATGSFADADISRAGSPAYLACDCRADLPTTVDPTLDTHFSALTTATDLYLLFDQLPTYAAGAGPGGQNRGDTLLAWFANLNELITAGVTFYWEIANNATFSSGLQRIARWNSSPAFNFGNWYTPNITTNGRVYCYQLDNAADTLQADVTNIEFMRLHLFGSAGVFAAHPPVLSEIWFGPRVCVTRSPGLNSKVPRHLKAFDPSIGKYASISGQRSDVVYAESRAAPLVHWDPFAAGARPEFGGTTDNGAQFLAQYRHGRHGTRPFVFVPNPLTAPDLAYLFQLEDPPFGLERIEGNRAATYAPAKWTEQPPFVEDETQDSFGVEP